MEFSRTLKRLYKYRSLAGPYDRPTAEDIILHNRMFWQSPVAFNDPFDCAPPVGFLGGRSALKRWASSAAKNVLPHRSRRERKAAAAQATRRSLRAIEDDLRASFDRSMRQSAITCFAEAGDVALMWAHYANSHSGVCFVFQERLEPNRFLAYDVFYSPERPKVDLANLRDIETFKKTILVKDESWSYEREHRMFDYRSGAGVRPFPPECLLGVILGARMSGDDEAYILDLVARRSIPLKVSRASLHPTQFSLVIS